MKLKYKVGDVIFITNSEEPEYKRYVGLVGVIKLITEVNNHGYPYHTHFAGYEDSLWNDREIRIATKEEKEKFEQLVVEEAI